MTPPARDVAVPRRHVRPVLMLLLATACWGLSFPITKALALIHLRLAPGSGTWFLAFGALAPRFVLGSIYLLAWQARGGWGVTRAELKQGCIIGLFAGVGMLWQTDGLQFTSASTSAFLTQFYAILIPVYSATRLRRNPGGRVWLSCALVLVGVAVLGHFNLRTFSIGRGEAETLLCSVFFMGQILWLGKSEFAANRPGKITLVTFVTQGVAFAILEILTAPSRHALVAPWTSVPWLGLTAVLTLVCTVGAYGLMNAWQPKISATEAGLIYCAEPIFSSVLALFLPAWIAAWAGIGYANETATSSLLLGGTLVTVANILLQLRPPRHEAV